MVDQPTHTYIHSGPHTFGLGLLGHAQLRSSGSGSIPSPAGTGTPLPDTGVLTRTDEPWHTVLFVGRACVTIILTKQTKYRMTEQTLEVIEQNNQNGWTTARSWRG
jgi:hypothetical protein